MSRDIRLDEIAQLARLDLTQMDTARLKAEFERILGYLDQLDEVADDAAEPRFDAGVELEPATPMRDDRKRPSLAPDEVVSESPTGADESNQFRVPRVIE